MFAPRSSVNGFDFAIIKRLGASPGSAGEVLAKWSDASVLLRLFVADQRHSLQLWSDDVALQIIERLAEKYPGQELDRR